jgi:ketosteroid isomerase-like protein
MQTALEAIHEYYEAFSTLDIRAILSFYCEPTLTVAPQGVLVASSHTTLADTIEPIVESLRAKGYGRSEFVEPDITMLGKTAALVKGIAIRYTAAGAEMERLPLGYLLYRSDAGWKIAALIVAS